MKNNTSESSVIFHKIKKMNSEILLETGKYGRSVRTKNKPIEAMILFKTKIGYKRDWDHKETIYSTWGSLSKFDSFTIQYDAWSNIHYGYLGFLVGFDKRLLLDAAGIAQAKSSTVPEGYLVRVLKGEGIFSGLDDPLDQESISIGIELAVAHGHELTLKQFKTYLRREAYRISQDR
ncbi:MAG: polymorphic toxin type 44 domain-containing protein [Candidatus Thiodiazotropha endolucinida]|nr:polymorphic toxin type 44 domain-containing protein [Candidatus Thiodiazotropha endolucinida]MCG8094262.1 polymorphic toxin type 44 domain-containing protein [Candidatus Thiodiazotropha endolucinida]MCW4228157.1 polymorphic toxin type 44 domain-containing protein [Candidatus Thiodiazotropha taylori]